MDETEFYKVCYPYMYLSRKMDERIVELFKKGYVKGTVTLGMGNEGTSIGLSLPLRPGKDPVSFMHRDIGSHLVFGSTPIEIFNQYMANIESPSHGREGNVHWGNAKELRFPMISHLGNMLAPVVGATWQKRKNDLDTYGLAVIGDGGASCGDFHESINLASVLNVPVIFLIENNHYAFSTPTKFQYKVDSLSKRASGYDLEGKTIDGTNPYLVYSSIMDFLNKMKNNPGPKILECMTLRFNGHAVYDDGKYLTDEDKKKCIEEDPLKSTRQKLFELGIYNENELVSLEKEIENEIQVSIESSLKVASPDPKNNSWSSYATIDSKTQKENIILPNFVSKKPLKNAEAINQALEYILENVPQSFILGLDIGKYGSAFKTTKGLVDKYQGRIIDMPLCESAITGFALGSSQSNGKPIVEFQFADFSTEAATQMALNSATWFYRSGVPAQILYRLPCGGNLTVGAFHSGEFEGIWSRFPGLKIFYPSTSQETFDAMIAGFFDPNPNIILENKSLYWSKLGEGNVFFNGNLEEILRPRNHNKGTDLTVVTIGSMLHETLAAQNLLTDSKISLDIWNPFMIKPLNLDPIIDSVNNTGRLLVIQESQEPNGIGHDIISKVTIKSYKNYKTAPRLLAPIDVPVPFAPVLESYYRPNKDKIIQIVNEMMNQ